MSATFPLAVKSFTPVVAGVDYPRATQIMQAYEEIEAIQQALLNGLAFPLLPDSTASARALGSSSQRFGQAYVKGLTLGTSSELTIAAGVITATPGRFSVDTESNAASDDLDTVTAGTGVVEGSIVILHAENVARVVTVKNATGNILLGADFVLSATNRVLMLCYDGTNWRGWASATSTPGVTGNGTTLQQLAFAATQSASSDVNTLDDYEEGSFTPTLIGTGGQSGQAYTTQVGGYVKVGKLVTFWLRLTMSTLGTVTTAAAVAGLPFASENTANLIASVSVGLWTNMGSSLSYVSGIIPANSSQINLYGTTSAASLSALTSSNLGNTSDLHISGSYRAAQ